MLFYFSYPPAANVNASGFNYDTATALIITFIVNNHVDEDKNKMAETWEKAFLKFVKEYKSDSISISYMAEVRMSCDQSNFRNLICELCGVGLQLLCVSDYAGWNFNIDYH